MPSLARIVTIGLSPVWQHVLEFERFEPGEVNRARRSAWCASGKSLNVALGIHSLGGEPISVSIAGGSTGEAIRRQFEAAGIDAHWVETQAPTRVCTTILDRAGGRATELVENQSPMTDEELDALQLLASRHISNAKFVVLSGSLPAGCPASFYADLMRVSGLSWIGSGQEDGPVTPPPGSQTGLLTGEACGDRSTSLEIESTQFLIDARGPELLAGLAHRPLLIKPNREELERTLGRSLATDDELIAAMKELNVAGARWVLVTQGSQPAFVTTSEETHRLPIVPVQEVINPIACGDALLAGIAWGLRRGFPMLESITIGLHCAAQNAADLMPCRLHAECLPGLSLARTPD